MAYRAKHPMIGYQKFFISLFFHISSEEELSSLDGSVSTVGLREDLEEPYDDELVPLEEPVLSSKAYGQSRMPSPSLS